MDESYPDTVIKVTDLRKKYRDLVAVDSISFDINIGEIFGLLGPNGAGKTTTIRMICGLLSSDGGKIDFNSQKKSDIRTLIGYCPQENIYFPKLTCYEQLKFIGLQYGLKHEVCKIKSSELLEMLGLSAKRDVFAGNLSGGMKRRLNIALALVHDPLILILDEPEAGLDPQSRILVRDIIKTFAKEKTIILTSHNMDEVDRLADRVAIMDKGKIMITDTPQNLKNSVGEGDVLEIELEKLNEESSKKLLSFIGNDFSPVLQDNILIIKAVNLVSRIHEITASIRNAGFEIKEIKLRENTLEDVFIHLTGKMLRQ
jgi:ABC-2 type transport system ATP-binding protein